MVFFLQARCLFKLCSFCSQQQLPAKPPVLHSRPAFQTTSWMLLCLRELHHNMQWKITSVTPSSLGSTHRQEFHSLVSLGAFWILPELLLVFSGCSSCLLLGLSLSSDTFSLSELQKLKSQVWTGFQFKAIIPQTRLTHYPMRGQGGLECGKETREGTQNRKKDFFFSPHYFLVFLFFPFLLSLSHIVLLYPFLLFSLGKE